MNLEELFSGSADKWLDMIPNYQKNTIRNLISANGSYEKAAEAWLNASIPMNKAQGAENHKPVYLDKVVDEIEALLRGDGNYEKIRKQILNHSGSLNIFFTSVLSQYLTNKIGTSAVFLAPVVVLIFMSITQIGINAWLKLREEKQNQVD